MSDSEPALPPQRLYWTRRLSLTARILAVNVIALGLLAGSLFYLDNYRNKLLTERFRQARAEVEITADALADLSRRRRETLLAHIGPTQGLRLRLYNARGELISDSFDLADPTYRLGDNSSQSAFSRVGSAIDKGVNFILGTPPIPEHIEPTKVNAEKANPWPEIAEARLTRKTAIRQRIAVNGTPVISVAAPVGYRGEVLLSTRYAVDFPAIVREARTTLLIIVGVALLVSIQLSLFLAKTIVQPLQSLMHAAVRVRQGRDRKVVVPRLPERHDEIGMLARAISDMNTALHQRVDAVESFAADVAHEIKNPLASLRSAVESLEKVKDPDLRQQLSEIANHDVRRIDRLITDISDASRVDAELSRAIFKPIDMAKLIQAIIADREDRDASNQYQLQLTNHGYRAAIVAGDPARLERVLLNLIDNAASFSQADGLITFDIYQQKERIRILVSDTGPGVPKEARDKVFKRFHSVRPESEDFGSHSGLGLAIARSIVEAHDGTLIATDRPDGQKGACFVINLPAWENHD